MLQRQSNIELLRIIAMLMILVLHANVLANGYPTSDEVQASFFSSFFRVLFESLSIVGVNVFVLISGWFGIKCTKRGFCNVLFQSVFCSVVGIGIFFLLHHCMPSSFLLMKEAYIGSSYWFVVSYLGLMVMAPVLNAFVENTSKEVLGHFLIVFFLFQILYGWLLLDVAHFINGNSILSFVGIYLLARYLRLYGKSMIGCGGAGHKFFAMYGGTALINSGFILGGIMTNNTFISQNVIDKVMAYCSPLVIVSSVFLFLGFTRLEVGYRRWINWMASSAFAIYLIHCNVAVLPDFLQLMSAIYKHFDGIICILIILSLLLVIGAICILIDQLRVYCWKKIVI